MKILSKKHSSMHRVLNVVRAAGPVALLLSVSCGGSNNNADGGDAGSQRVTYSTTLCANADMAWIRDENGVAACTRVGSDGSNTMGEWPDTADLPAPVVFVRPGATGGDGSQAMPFGDIGMALAATPSPRSIVLARGTHMLPATGIIALDAPLDVRGVGSAMGGTQLMAPRLAPALLANGPTAVLTVRALSIRYEGVTDTDVAAVGVQASRGGRAVVRNVLIEDPYMGVAADGARVEATQLTVLRARFRGASASRDVTSMQRGSLRLEDFRLRDGVRYGVVVIESQAELLRGGVIENGLDGFAVLGGDVAMPSSVSFVSLQCNGVTAMRAERAGAAIQGRRLVLSGTRVPMGNVGGDGLFVGAGARVTIDTDLSGDAAQGLGSELVGNARAGVLVDSNGMPAPMSQLTLHGGLIGSNRGPGLYAQNRALVANVAYTRIGDNTALGIGATSGASLVSLQCNGIFDTRIGMLNTVSGAVELGDGLSIAEQTSGMNTGIINSEFARNGRFGAVFSGANATLMGNRGEGNGIGIGVYGGTVTNDAPSSVTGAMPAPTAPPPTARGLLGAYP